MGRYLSPPILWLFIMGVGQLYTMITCNRCPLCSKPVFSCCLWPGEYMGAWSGRGESETKLPFASFSKAHSYTCGAMVMGGGHIQPLEADSTSRNGTQVMGSSPLRTMFDRRSPGLYVSSTKASITSINEPVTLEKETLSRIIKSFSVHPLLLSPLCRRKYKAHLSSLGWGSHELLSPGFCSRPPHDEASSAVKRIRGIFWFPSA